jgi:hypothetical protein
VASWEQLTNLPPSQRANAAIELELRGTAGPADRLAAGPAQRMGRFAVIH